MAKKNRKQNVDTKMAAANDSTGLEKVETQVTELAEVVVERETKVTPKPQAPATPQAKATAVGANYAKLAGRPSKQQVTYVFGTVGYALSWVSRAIKLGITPEELCQEFVKDPEGLKVRYAEATAKKVEAPKA